MSRKKIAWSLMLLFIASLPIHAQITDKEQKQFDNNARWAKTTKYLWMNFLIPTSTSPYSKWIEWYEKELETVEDLENKISIYYMLGKFERIEGNFDKSLTYLEAGLNELRTHPELKIKEITNHISNLDLVDELGQLYVDLRAYDKAEAIFNEALIMRQEKLGMKNRALANTYNGLGDINFYQKEYEKAVGFYTKALDLVLNGAGLYGSNTIASNTYNRMARAFYGLGIYEEAVKTAKSGLRRSMRIRMGAMTDPLQSMRSMNLLAMTYLKMGDLERANKRYTEANDLYIKSIIQLKRMPIQNCSRLKQALHGRKINRKKLAPSSNK